jgi:hypothetical protein
VHVPRARDGDCGRPPHRDLTRLQIRRATSSRLASLRHVCG